MADRVSRAYDPLPPLQELRNFREQLRSRNALVNEVVTRATGKALKGQKPLFNPGPEGCWFASTTALGLSMSGVILGTWAIPDAGLANIALIPAVAVGLVAMTGRLRAQQVVFAHHSVHSKLSRRWPWLNDVGRHFGTIIPFSQNPDDYKLDHAKKHHHLRIFTTADDPDAEFLLQLGFRPGMSRRQLYANLWRTMVSPRFHWRFAKARILSAFVTASPRHRGFALAWLAAFAAGATMLPWWVVSTAALPFGPLYHISALLQFLTEHAWLRLPNGPQTRADYENGCVGRFSLVRPPEAGLTGLRAVGRWGLWALRMVPELLVRLGVMVGDLPAHDHHHLAHHIGHSADRWHIAIFERQRSIDEGDPARLASREVYGLKEALDWVFNGLAEADASANTNVAISSNTHANTNKS